jgi:hypothetical protein
MLRDDFWERINRVIRGFAVFVCDTLFNRLRNTDYVIYQQFNIQQLYVLPALC